MSEYLSHLNESQKEAVINTEGPSLVIAGAGSGKTRVLTYRIAHLLEKGVKPYRILALTFTNKAAKEMKNRIAEMIGKEKAASLKMGTFHSIFAKILRKEAEKLGYTSDFTIYDAIDTKSLIKNIIKELKLDDTKYKPAAVYSRISKAKNNLITAVQYEANTQVRTDDRMSGRAEIYRVFKIYSDKCKKSGAMDFDDLLLNLNILFRDFPDVLEKYQSSFDYILVDEYQDTNFSQYLIVKKLSETHKNICVVGDDAQSIYSFRGAKIENILNFKKDYKKNNFKVFKLEQNYRSTKNIVEAANSVINKNENRIPKKVFSENESGEKIKLLEALTDNEEGYLVVNKIFDAVYIDKSQYYDHAILYRTNAQSRIFEEALRRRNIPYKIYGGLSFYQRKEIKDILAYFKFVVNKRDDEALKRIINYPRRGIGGTSVEKIEGVAINNNVSMWVVLEHIVTGEIKINSRIETPVKEFVKMINEVTETANNGNAYEAGKEIASKSGILHDLFQDKAPEGVARHENVQELLNGLKEFTEQAEGDEEINLSSYLENVSLLTDQDTESEEDINKVTLMTIHSAKGLEFKYVYIVGAEERLFPSEMSSFSLKELEEERRLFYVAVTRAEKVLHISYARQRYRWGNLYDCVPSRFVKEIDQKYIDYSETQDNEQQQTFKEEKISYKVISNSSNYNPKLKRLSSVKNAPENNQNADIGDIKPGVTVSHARFGKGVVIEVSGDFPNTKATVEFETAGKKSLLLKFAKLQLV